MSRRIVRWTGYKCVYLLDCTAQGAPKNLDTPFALILPLGRGKRIPQFEQGCKAWRAFAIPPYHFAGELVKGEGSGVHPIQEGVRFGIDSAGSVSR